MWVRSQNGVSLIDVVAFEIVANRPNQQVPESYTLNGIPIGVTLAFPLGVFSTADRAFYELNVITKAASDGVAVYGVQPDVIPQQSPQGPQ